jgi:hypothetical protein
LPDHRKPAGLTIVDELAAHRVVRTLTRYADGFTRPSAWASISFSVSAVSGQVRATKSACGNSALSSDIACTASACPALIESDFGGRVRASLNFTVGNGHNVQFLFSSGQRRAAGLAFLLAIHLSRRWCKWQSLLLDDPVQHIDDYRALNLVEVRLRSSIGEIGRRFELRTSKTGSAEIASVEDIYLMPREVLRRAQASQSNRQLSPTKQFADCSATSKQLIRRKILRPCARRSRPRCCPIFPSSWRATQVVV